MDGAERDALLKLASYAMDEDQPGAWIKRAVMAMIAEY